MYVYSFDFLRKSLLLYINCLSQAIFKFYCWFKFNLLFYQINVRKTMLPFPLCYAEMSPSPPVKTGFAGTYPFSFHFAGSSNIARFWININCFNPPVARPEDGQAGKYFSAQIYSYIQLIINSIPVLNEIFGS